MNLNDYFFFILLYFNIDVNNIFTKVKQDVKPNLLLQILSILSKDNIIYLALYILSCLTTIFLYLNINDKRFINTPFVYPEG